MTSLYRGSRPDCCRNATSHTRYRRRRSNWAVEPAIAFMTHDPIAGKQSDGSSPFGALDASAAGREPEGQCRSEDDSGSRMLSSKSPRFSKKPGLAPNLRYWIVALAPAVVICSIPFAVLLVIVKSNIRPHFGLLNLLPVLAGCWLIVVPWIALHKGMGSLSRGEDSAGVAWLVLGLINFIAALGTFLFLALT